MSFLMEFHGSSMRFSVLWMIVVISWDSMGMNGLNWEEPSITPVMTYTVYPLVSSKGVDQLLMGCLQ